MPFNQTVSGDEVDTLTASVQLDNGVHTNPISVDLRYDTAKQSGPAGQLDFMDCASTVEVATYMKGKQPVKWKITVNVRDLHGQNVPFLISPKDTVADLKVLISKKTMINRSEFFLTFGASTVEDCRPLSYYGIENGSVLIMKIRNRGG